MHLLKESKIFLQENWSISRKIVSKGANLLFKLFIGTNIKDVTGGYRTFRFEIIRKLMKRDLSSKGYEFQIETIYHVSQMTKKIIEIPFVFKNRTAGKSKLSLLDVIQFALKIVSLRNSTIQYSPPLHKITEKIYFQFLVGCFLFQKKIKQFI